MSKGRTEDELRALAMLAGHRGKLLAPEFEPNLEARRPVRPRAVDRTGSGAPGAEPRAPWHPS